MLELLDELRKRCILVLVWTLNVGAVIKLLAWATGNLLGRSKFCCRIILHLDIEALVRDLRADKVVAVVTSRLIHVLSSTTVEVASLAVKIAVRGSA